MNLSKVKKETGEAGVQATVVELTNRGYVVKAMPNHNRGFDIDCESPMGRKFKVEVKTSKSKGTQIPIQMHYLEGASRNDLFFVLIKATANNPQLFEYYILTHEELKAAWTLMPKLKMNGEPYVINGGYIDWSLIKLQLNRWYKLPK